MEEQIYNGEKNDRYFRVFSELYSENKVNFTIRRNSYGMNIQEKEIPEDIDIQELKAFIRNIFNNITKSLTNGKIDENYKKYIEDLRECKSDLFDRIALKIFSNLNTIEEFEFEVITSHAYTEVIPRASDSILLKLVYLEPVSKNDLQKVLTLELSKCDLIDLKDEVTKILDYLNSKR